jgi:hypothetical protein
VAIETMSIMPWITRRATDGELEPLCKVAPEELTTLKIQAGTLGLSVERRLVIALELAAAEPVRDLPAEPMGRLWGDLWTWRSRQR